MDDSVKNIDRSEPIYSIGDVVKMTGVSKARLNDYDKKGILVPKRAKKDIDQDWRLYSEDDIDRLQKIDVLLAYGFLLKEIEKIIDGEVDLFEAFDEKLADLRNQENRIRNLIFFAKFADLSDGDLYANLSMGPQDIDEMANLVRQQITYQQSSERIASISETEWNERFQDLDLIIEDFMSLNEEDGIDGIEVQIERFYSWWMNCLDSDDNARKYLNFWSIFEDNPIIAAEVERVGGETATANLEMWAFYIEMKKLMANVFEQVAEVASLTDKDVLLAMAKAENLVDTITNTIGIDSADRNLGTFELCMYLIEYMKRIWGDGELREFLELKDVAHFSHGDLDLCIYVLALMTGSPEEYLDDEDLLPKPKTTTEGS